MKQIFEIIPSKCVCFQTFTPRVQNYTECEKKTEDKF